MADELLRTKLMPPPGHVDLVQRERLHNQLEAGLRLPLTLIVAQAGSGKTSLVRSWRTSCQDKTPPLAWVALDEADNDPVRFWRYVIAALETLLPDFGDTARNYLDGASQASVQPALVSLLNRLTELDERWVLALDDYHLIDAPEIHAEVTFLIENLPEHLRILLISRSDPPLPLARWRARGQLMEIREADLRFTGEETLHLMNTELDAGLKPEQIATLHDRTEGWAAGLHLAALALRGRDNPDDFLASFSGSHHFVLTYLAEDVLDQQTPELLDFLFKTSILAQLSGPLCDAVTGGSDGDRILRELARVNLFTMPLDDEGNWYRYHHLFAGVLHHQLQIRDHDSVAGLQRSAAEWYEEQGLVEQAINHALKAGDIGRATRLIQSISRDTLTKGEARIVRRWLDSLPPETLNSSMRMLLAGGWSQVLTGPIDRVEQWFTAAEKARPDDPAVNDNDFLGEVATMKTVVNSFKGMVAETIDRAEEALGLITAEEAGLHSLVAMSLGHAHLIDGNLEESARRYREAIEHGLQSNNLFSAIDSMVQLGVVLMQQGSLHQANAMMRHAERVVIEKNITRLPVAGSVTTVWPEILVEMNEIETALDLVQRGLELGRQGAKTDLLINGYRSLGAVHWALGNWDDAIEFSTRSAEASRGYGLTHVTRVTEARIAHMHLGRGDVGAAQEWAASLRPDATLPEYAHEAEGLMLARICIASGDPGSALEILGSLLQPAKKHGRIRSVMEILNLEALAHVALGDDKAGLTRLAESLGYAAPEGYIRLFLNEGPAMANLLRLAVAQDIQAGFAGRLQEQFDVSAAFIPQQNNDAATLVEPMSDREQAVLRLMSAGLTAPEIANELYVAASTVRTHLKNIYRKLDVHSRDQAIARARELALI